MTQKTFFYLYVFVLFALTVSSCKVEDKKEEEQVLSQQVMRLQSSQGRLNLSEKGFSMLMSNQDAILSTIPIIIRTSAKDTSETEIQNAYIAGTAIQKLQRMPVSQLHSIYVDYYKIKTNCDKVGTIVTDTHLDISNKTQLTYTEATLGSE